MPVSSGPTDPGFPLALRTLGFDDRWAALFAALPAEARPLRVVRGHRGAVIAAGDVDGVRLTTPPAQQPVVGDWVAAMNHRVVAIAERSSAVVRRRADGDPHVLAANVDLVGIVHGLDQPLNRRRLERGLVLAWESGAHPVVILTKADVAGDPVEAARIAAASGPGVEVVVASVVDGRGLGDVRGLLQPNRTMALIGASGSGKSSLANALLDTEAMTTQPVRVGDRRGRHTTTHRELLIVPGGGILLDTPGLRALTIGAAADGVDKTFPEIDQLSEGCRFGDCRHDREPGCAVLAALESGTLAADRFEGWRRVRREADNARLRADPVALRQRNRQWGRFAREAAHHKRRPDSRRGRDGK